MRGACFESRPHPGRVVCDARDQQQARRPNAAIRAKPARTRSSVRHAMPSSNVVMDQEEVRGADAGRTSSINRLSSCSSSPWRAK